MAVRAGSEPASPTRLPKGREQPPAPAPAGARTGRLVRRPTDFLLALVALGVLAVVLGLVEGLPTGSTEISRDVSRWLHHVPRWLSSGAEVIAALGCIAVLIVALVKLLRQEAQSALNAGVAAVLAAAAAIAVTSVWQSQHGSVSQAVLHGRNPSIFVVDAAFIAFLVASDLVRRARWERWCVLSGGGLLFTGLAVNSLTPFAVVVALFGALFVGWSVRWAFGAPSVRPGTDELLTWLSHHDLPVAELHGSAHGSSRLGGTLENGTAIEVRMANRDTRGEGLARQLWSHARLRPLVTGHVALSSRAQLEQLALTSFLANGAGVRSPAVLLLNEMPNETYVLALQTPSGATMGETSTLADATSMFVALRALHNAGVAHRDLRAENLLVAPDGVGFSSLDAAVPGAGELVRRLDITQLLTTLGRRVGPDQAVVALRQGYKPASEEAIAATLQPIALAPWGWSAMREARGCVAEVRRALIGADTTTPITRLERFRWSTVLSTIALTVVAFLLIGQLSKVNLLGALQHANFGWLAVAILGSALTYVAASVNLAAFVPKHLSVVRGFFVQLATAFVGVAMPPTVGHVAVNARYLSRQNVDQSSIAAAVALSQIVNIVTTIPLLIVFALLTGSGISRFKIVPGVDLLIGIGVIAAAGGVLLLIPKTRELFNDSVWPRVRGVWPRLISAVSQPLRLLVGIGANLALTLGYLIAFLAALHAVGAHPALLPAAIVYLAGNTVGSVAPTPGGLGAVEAVLSAGLTAIGVPAHEAIPGVLLFRVATFWLPIPAGWVSYVFLQRNGTL
jgi:glycosyltransferase 2 family protein